MSAPTRPLDVLVVDDSAPLRAAVTALLGSERLCAVVADAADGAEGVRLAELLEPDCVVLDLDMPVLGGLEALPEIKRRSPLSKVVVFSGLEEAGSAARARAAGADACVEKPAGMALLLPTILRVCAAGGVAGALQAA